MPLLPTSQIESLFPPLAGKKKLIDFARKALSIETLSRIYDTISSAKGEDFTRALLDVLNVDYRIGNPERLQNLPEGAFITISNHPYGGLDGIMLVDMFGHVKKGFKVVANNFLSVVESLRPSLITVDPVNDANTGVTSRNINGLREVLGRLHEGFPVGFFPSGAVSDLSLKEMRIHDRQWQDSVIRLIAKCGVPVVPVRFFDKNSTLFYLLGLIDWKVRTMRLPRELVNKKGHSPRIGIGETVSVEEIKSRKSIPELRDYLCSKVYEMPVAETFTPHSSLGF